MCFILSPHHVCIIFAVYALHLLVTLTHLLSKANGCVLGVQSAMEKDGTWRSLASSHNPLLQMNSKSQREAFLQERKTHRQKKPGELRRLPLGSHRSCSDHTATIPTQFAQGTWALSAPQSFLCGIADMPDHGEGGAEGNNPQTVTKGLPTHLDKPE